MRGTAAGTRRGVAGVALAISLSTVAIAHAWDAQPGSLAGMLQVGGPSTGLSAFPPTTYKFGHVLDYSLDGPFHLSLGTQLSVRAGFFGFDLAPSVKYKFLWPDSNLVPYGYLGWELLLISAEGGVFTGALGARFGGGLVYMMLERLGLAIDLSFSLGGLLPGSIEARARFGSAFYAVLQILLGMVYTF